MKKKIIVLFMATLMVGGVLTGCGSEKEAIAPKNEEVVVEDTSVENEVVETSEEVAETEVTEETETEETNSAATNATENVRKRNVAQILTNHYYRWWWEPLSNDVYEDSVVIFVASIPRNEDMGVTENTEFVPYLYSVNTGDENYPNTVNEAILDGKSVVKLTEVDLKNADKKAKDDVMLPSVLYCETESFMDTPEYCAEILTTSDLSLFIPFSNDFSRVSIGDKSYMVFRTYNEMIDAENVYYTVIQDMDKSSYFNVVCDTAEYKDKMIENSETTGFVVIPTVSSDIDKMFWKE